MASPGARIISQPLKVAYKNCVCGYMNHPADGRQKCRCCGKPLRLEEPKEQKAKLVVHQGGNRQRGKV